MAKGDELTRPEDVISAALLGGSFKPAGSGPVPPGPSGLVMPSQGPRIIAPDPATIAALAGLHGMAFMPQRQSQQSQAQWGTPTVEWVKDENQEPGNRPETGAAYGRTETIATDGSPAQEMARVMTAVGDGFLLSVDVLVPPGTTPASAASNPNIALAVWAVLTFGSGNATSTRKIRVDDRLDASLVGNFVSVKIYLGDSVGKQVASVDAKGGATASAQVAVQVGRGIRGTPNVATIFRSSQGTNGQFFGPTGVAGPCRICSLSSHLQASTGGADIFLQIFDSASKPVSGVSVPTGEWALGTTPSPGLAYIQLLNQRGISQQFWWAASTTSGLLTTAANPIWITAEILLF